MEDLLLARLESGKTYASADEFYEEVLSSLACQDEKLNAYRRIRDRMTINRLQDKYADRWA